MNHCKISYKRNKICGIIELPASKSESNRALIIKALSNDEFAIHNLSNAKDTSILEELLHKINLKKGLSEINTIDVGSAGSVMRFLCVYLSIIKGNWILKGDQRMEERPIGPLVNAIIQIGGTISYLKSNGFPPLLIEGKELRGGMIEIDSSVSSQFISALLMVAPLLKDGLIINLKGKVVSKPYILMTLKMMQHVGVNCQFNNKSIEIRKQEYHSNEININYDWSAASFFYEIIALSEIGSSLFFKNLRKESLQGDEIVSEIFYKYGVVTYIESNGIRIVKQQYNIDEFSFDFTDCPDLAQPTIVSCAALGIKGNFTGLKSLTIKETDRIFALKTELVKLGVNVEIINDENIIVNGIVDINGKEIFINTYQDHRMAMSFAPLALKIENIIIENPTIVNKSFIEFWDNINNIGLKTVIID